MNIAHASTKLSQMTSDTFERNEAIIEANEIFNQGFQHWIEGKPNAALRQLGYALIIFQIIDEPTGVAHTLSAIASIHRDLGNEDEALERFKQALAIQIEIRAYYNAARSLTNIGALYVRLNKPRKAVYAYHRAIRIFQKIGDRPKEAELLQQLGNLYIQAGHYSKATACFHQSLENHWDAPNHSHPCLTHH